MTMGRDLPRIFLISNVLLIASYIACLNPAHASLEMRRTPIVRAIENASPAVVNIGTEQIVRQRIDPFGGFRDDFFRDFDDFFDDFFDSFPTRDYKRQTLGSGVIISTDGYILTNQHVILQASRITVTLPDHREYEGTVVGADPKIDLAIVKIDVDDDLPVASLGESESLMIGETVIAIGNPFGLEHTVTTGVISAKNRSIRGGGGQVYSNFIQTDASINPGNSGGPLINIDGDVIGINTAIYAQAEGIGFAIPIDKCKRVIDDLMQYGEIKQAWVGVRVQALTGELAEMFGYTGGHGVLVSDILDGASAELTDLQPGDIVMEVNHVPISSPDDFYGQLSGLLIDETAQLKIFRDGREQETTAGGAPLPLEDALDIAGTWLGVTVQSVDETTMAQYRLATRSGVVLTDVFADGRAYRIGLRAGDVMHQLGPVEISDIDDFKKAVLLASERSSVLLVIQRGRALYNTTIDLSK